MPVPARANGRACTGALTGGGSGAEILVVPAVPAPEWYAICQAALCLGAAWAILSMYVRGTPHRRDEPEPGPSARDPGLLWLGLGVGVWGLVGVTLLWPLPAGAELVLRPLLSSANSACLLISASHLDYGPELLRRAQDWRHWRRAAIAGSLLTAALTLALAGAFGISARLAQLPDLLLSLLTLALYGFGLSRSFLRRGFPSLSVLAAVAVGAQLLAQLPELSGPVDAIGLTAERRWALNLSSKALTVVAFLALAMSWVHELARRPLREAVRLTFTGQARARGARRRYVVIANGAELELRETPHRDLLALALRRLQGTADGGWVSLPDLVGRLDDSRIRRLREDLRPAGLDGAVEANFQKAYRLALEPSQLSLDRAALGADPELARLLGGEQA